MAPASDPHRAGGGRYPGALPEPGWFADEEESRVPIAEVEKIWMDGELVDWADAKIHVLSHALHYGSGVFEGIRAYETSRGPAVWHLEEHLQRLFRSAKLYHMALPYTSDQLIGATKDVIRANGLSSCYVRPIAFRGYGEMGVNPLNAPINVSIAVWPWGAYLGEEALEQGVRIKISSWRRNSQNALPAAAKADGQYINSVLAKVESLKAGYDEAIMLNEAGYITDGSGENVFVVRDGVLFTPPTQAGCLDGITRGVVITLAEERGYTVRQENLVRTDLYNADEVFFTGTAAELTPIREVDDRRVGAGHRGPVTKELQDAFFAATKGEDPTHTGWLTYVDD
jgi:branched-chain amino acid aminotransferase